MEANDETGSPAFDARALDPTEHFTHLHVDNPGELIAAIPAMLGFFLTWTKANDVPTLGG